jgi:Fe-S-cluster containining protein
MYEFYSMKIDESVIKDMRKELRELYVEVPETKGCMENISKSDGCGAWCCEQQFPQVMYSEFLNTWHSILNGRTTDQIASLVIKAVRIYLSDTPTKGCMMWNKQNKQCTIHSTRPLNCRMYGQIPEEEFKPRYERLKILYQDEPGAVIKDQCNLVETVGTKPTKEQSDGWQQKLQDIEESIGIPSILITDKPGGTYRTFHDHILLRMCGGSFLLQVTDMKMSGTKEQKEEFIKNMVEKLRRTHPNLVDTKDEDAPKPQIIIEA